MKERWHQLSARFNALARRERVLIFVAAVVGTILLFQTLVLDPLMARQRRLTQQLAETRQNVKASDALLKALETTADPDVVRRTYRDALRKQLEEIDAGMRGLQKGLVPPERMPKLLEEMLAKRGLQLVALRTLPVQRFESPAAASAPVPGAKGEKPAPREADRSIYQHSVEVTLQGSYIDLHDYLVHLEGSPLHMFWGRLNMDSAQYPRLKVTLTVHTLSLSKAWLVV